MPDVPLQVSPVPAADIDATGTRDATTYLRGDGAWATPAGGGGGGGAVPTWMEHLDTPQDTPVWADEFATDTLANYTAIAPSGTTTAAIGRDVLSIRFKSQSAAHMSALVQPIPTGLTYPIALETRWRTYSHHVNFAMSGPCLTAGTAVTSGATWFRPYLHGNVPAKWALSSGTVQAVSATFSEHNMQTFGGSQLQDLFHRIVLSSATVIEGVYLSPNGVQWTRQPSDGFANVTMPFTATHFGFGVSTWGAITGALAGGRQWTPIASVDYLRIYDDLTAWITTHG